jgi:hypothetical protein
MAVEAVEGRRFKSENAKHYNTLSVNSLSVSGSTYGE